jgi:light-independent protochlorophyllide reductase subunit B
VIFDTWVHPLVMGLEEHLLHMFRDDFEFHDDAGASHHGGKAVAREEEPAAAEAASAQATAALTEGAPLWCAEAERELKKIPFFVRGKARRNTETFAAEKGLSEISIDTLYEAKAHYAR